MSAFRDTIADAGKIAKAKSNDGTMSWVSDAAVQLAARESQLSALSDVPPDYAATMDAARRLSAAATAGVAAVQHLIAVLRPWPSVSTTILAGINGTDEQTLGTAVESLSGFISALAPAVQACNPSAASFFWSELEARPHEDGEGIEGPVPAASGAAAQEEISRLQRELVALVHETVDVPGSGLALYARIVHIRAEISTLQGEASAGGTGETVELEPILYEMSNLGMGLVAFFQYSSENAGDALESLNDLSLRLQEDQPLVPEIQRIFAQSYTEDMTNISKTINAVVDSIN